MEVLIKGTSSEIRDLFKGVATDEEIEQKIDDSRAQSEVEKAAFALSNFIIDNHEVISSSQSINQLDDLANSLWDLAETYAKAVTKFIGKQHNQ